MKKEDRMPIIKHNKLIETSYKLNSREQFFILYLISQISQKDLEFREHTMHFSEIERILNFDGKRRIANKSELFELMDNLNKEPIIYENEDVIGKSVWLQHIEYNKKTDEVTFSLSKKLKDYLLQLKEHFTQYNIGNIIYLNAHAIRLYELLKRHQYKGECVLMVDKIKFYLGIENKYPKFYEFKRWVLIPAQKELKKYTDIDFTFEPAKKERRRILSLRFHIKENNPSHNLPIQLLSKKGKTEEAIVVEDMTTSKATASVYEHQLTRSQLMAFEFLAKEGVNKTYIIERILEHTKVKYEVIQGYEDYYIKALWHFFSKKTRATNKAGAFVSWWKNGRLTTDGLHAKMLELVQKKKKELDEDALANRELAKGMTAIDFKNSFSKENITYVTKETKIAERLKNRVGVEQMNFEKFKNVAPEKYQKLKESVIQDFQKIYESANQSFDLNKNQKAIEEKIRFKFDQMYKK